jgi:hypothetical protein
MGFRVGLNRLPKVRVVEFALFFMLLVSFIYTFPRWADPNQNSRLNMVFAVVEDGTFQIDRYVENTVDYAKVGEHYYSDKAPGTAFLGIPIYAGLKVFLDSPLLEGVMDRLANNDAFRATLRAEGTGILAEKVRFAIAQVVLTFFLAALPSAITGVLMFRLLATLTSKLWSRFIMVLGYGLFTPAFAYAGALYGHQLSAAFLFAAFYIIFMRRNRLSGAALFSVGGLLGLSVVTEYPSILMVGVLMLYILYILRQEGDLRLAGWAVLSGGFIALAWMAYNTAVFGGPLNLGYSQSELWTDQHGTGFMSLTLPHWDAIWGITFGAFRGLFILSPWLLLFFPGLFLWRQTRKYRPEFWVVLANVVGIFLFNASSIMWWGGFAVGPRYLLPMLPFMVLPVAFVIDRWGNKAWFRVILVLFLIWSFLATWGLTLADQAFPSDSIRNPLLEYAIPNWLEGNIARNLGTIAGIPGVWSLAPLVVLLIFLSALVWITLHRRSYSQFDELAVAFGKKDLSES